MRVEFVTLSSQGKKKRWRRQDSLGNALEVAAKSDLRPRIAFGGKTKQGRAGVALDFEKQKVTGHKMETIPASLVDRVRHFPLSKARQAIEVFSEGIDVLIGKVGHGLLLTWSGSEFEAFGDGDDSYEPLL